MGLGPLAGQRLVHLQCNSGKDSLCLARHGAQVLGVDLSDTAIEAATRLASDSGIPASFHRSEVVEFLGATDRRFDIVFASYGAVCLLPDLAAWAAGIERVLDSGGAFVLVEFHPVALQLECATDVPTATIDDLRFRYSMDTLTPTLEPGVDDYVASSGSALLPMGRQLDVPEFVNDEPCVCFDHSLGAILSALLGAGLTIETVREHPWSNGFAIFPFLELGEDRRWRFPAGAAEFPLMFGLRAVKQR